MDLSGLVTSNGVVIRGTRGLGRSSPVLLKYAAPRRGDRGLW
jgi:hypothetical protein